MRHRKKGKRLSRPMAHRDAVLRNLAKYLIMHGRIKTTITKAKLLREVVEPLVTRAKIDTVNNRREVAKVINDKALVKKLFTEIGPFYKERQGGYTRIIRYKNRPGDNALLALIEFVDYEQFYKKPEKVSEKDKKTKEKVVEKDQNKKISSKEEKNVKEKDSQKKK
jgi:large subunit ribosomal protein L17